MTLGGALFVLADAARGAAGRRSAYAFWTRDNVPPVLARGIQLVAAHAEGAGSTLPSSAMACLRRDCLTPAFFPL